MHVGGPESFGHRPVGPAGPAGAGQAPAPAGREHGHIGVPNYHAGDMPPGSMPLSHAEHPDRSAGLVPATALGRLALPPTQDGMRAAAVACRAVPFGMQPPGTGHWSGTPELCGGHVYGAAHFVGDTAVAHALESGRGGPHAAGPAVGGLRHLDVVPTGGGHFDVVPVEEFDDPPPPGLYDDAPAEDASRRDRPEPPPLSYVDA